MKNSIYLCIVRILWLFILLPTLSFSQVEIGSDSPPLDSDDVCNIPVYIDPDGTNNTSGLFVGDDFEDFILYDVNDGAYQLSEALDDKAMLLVSGSYTCPRFRANLNELEEILIDFGEYLDVWIVYCVEAHPIDDISPYFGFVNPSTLNTTLGIEYNQPDIYADRRTTVEDMLADLDIPAPVLLDTPCNDWWDVYGPAENNAYLIDQSGEIVIKHGWLNNFQLDMYADIEAWLNDDEPDPEDYNGAFILESLEVEGQNLTNTLMVAEAVLANETDSPVAVDILKEVNWSTANWEFSLCSGICYNPTIDSIRVVIQPQSELTLTTYCYLNGLAGEAELGLEFNNPFDANNVDFGDVHFESTYTGVGELLSSQLSVYQNGDWLYTQVKEQFGVKLYDLQARLIRQSKSEKMFVGDLQGIFLIQAGKGSTQPLFISQ